MLKCLTLLTLIIGLSGCAQPQIQPADISIDDLETEQNLQFKAALEYQAQQRLRLSELAFPLLQHNASACGARTRNSLGILLHQLSDYPLPQQTAAKALYGDSKAIMIQSVLKTGPAFSQLQPGDQLLSINNTPVADNACKALTQIKTELKNGEPLTLQIKRDDQEKKLRITPVKICDYAVVLSGSDSINGYADGGRIIITSGLMRFAREDNQLALIIAHELAHNHLQHIPKRLQNSAFGLLLDIALSSSGIPSPLIGTGFGANLYSQAFETEADLEGLRLLQQAGYSLDGLDQFWLQMAMLHPASITHRKTVSHPTTAERAIRIRRFIQQLQSDQQ